MGNTIANKWAVTDYPSVDGGLIHTIGAACCPACGSVDVANEAIARGMPPHSAETFRVNEADPRDIYYRPNGEPVDFEKGAAGELHGRSHYFYLFTPHCRCSCPDIDEQRAQLKRMYWRLRNAQTAARKRMLSAARAEWLEKRFVPSRYNEQREWERNQELKTIRRFVDGRLTEG